MPSTTHLNVTRPVAIWKRELNLDYKKLFSSVSKALIDAGTARWDLLGKDIIDVAAGMGLAETPGHKAFFLIHTALVRACTEIAMEGLTFRNGYSAEAVAQLGSLFEEQLVDQELQIDINFFENPRALSIVETVRQIFANWITLQGHTQAEAETVSFRLPSYFVNHLNDLWRKVPAFYETLAQELKTPFTEAVQREQSWRVYQAYLEKEIDKNIFNEPFGLRQVYIPLNAYYEEKIENSDQLDQREKVEKKRIVAPLADHLTSWLHIGDTTDALRLISGGPGAGKSSFAKIFAAQQGFDCKSQPARHRLPTLCCCPRVQRSGFLRIRLDSWRCDRRPTRQRWCRPGDLVP